LFCRKSYAPSGLNLVVVIFTGRCPVLLAGGLSALKKQVWSLKQLLLLNNYPKNALIKKLPFTINSLLLFDFAICILN